ncbi:MAG: hypothetical protein P1U56_15970 [Saprospiraceae bacterium]|nr:hypothetical protein [Saprospiraceae bacterium]
MTFEDVKNRLNKLEEVKELSKRDKEDLLLIAYLDIRPRTVFLLQKKNALHFQTYLSIEEQISLCEHWFRNRRYRKTAIMMIFRNYNKIVGGIHYLNEQIRLFSGDHCFRKEQNFTRVICFQLIYNFDYINSRIRNRMVEMLVKGMNHTTGMAARKLFGRKFNLLPVNLRNKILEEILENKSLPDYFIRSFLNEKYEQVNLLNIQLIKQRLLELDESKRV